LTVVGCWVFQRQDVACLPLVKVVNSAVTVFQPSHYQEVPISRENVQGKEGKWREMKGEIVVHRFILEKVVNPSVTTYYNLLIHLIIRSKISELV